MKGLRGIVLGALAVGLALPPAAAEPASPAWSKLKSLAGDWVGTYDGQPARVSYKLVSGGTALMESLEVDKDGSRMVSLYAPDGGSVLMTHYCTLGNQPRLRAAGFKDGQLDFVYVDVANLRSGERARHEPLGDDLPRRGPSRPGVDVPGRGQGRDGALRVHAEEVRTASRRGEPTTG